MNQHFTIDDKYKQVQSLGALRTSQNASAAARYTPDS